jgi:hypothetical protein
MAKYKRALVLMVVAAAVTWFQGCGGSGSPPSPPPVTAPTLSSLSPIVTMANIGVTLTASGTGFTASSQIVFNGNTKAATLSNGQLTAQLQAGDVAQAGTFQVTVQQTSSLSSNSLNFYVVPAVNPTPVAVSAGRTTAVPAVAVQQPKSFGSKPLSWVAVGSGNSAGATSVSVKQGVSVTLFTVGQGFQGGTFFAVSGNPSDVTVTQPLLSDFSQTTDGIPSANVTLNVSSSATLGARSLLVINPAGEVSVFPGGLIIAQGP